MASSRKRKKKSKKNDTNSEKAPVNEPSQVSVDDWDKQDKPVRRRFDGPRDASAPLRISFKKDAYSEIVLHAKESLDAEICGVLVGQVCEDDEGVFIAAEAAIRGDAAVAQRTHVTFTQDTWNAIHAEKDSKYSDLRIIGWYHSHPGFGVELSDMDRFIHKNFFSSETQIGLIVDPLSGEVAAFTNRDGEVLDLDRFWIDGREHKCYVPTGTDNSDAENSEVSSAAAAQIEDMNIRLGQTIQALDDLRSSLYRFFMIALTIICFGVVAFVGYNIYTGIFSKRKPPERMSFAEIPVRIGDKTVFLGLQIVAWEIPPELDSVFLQLAEKKLAEFEEAAKKLAEEQEKQGKTQKQEDPAVQEDTQVLEDSQVQEDTQVQEDSQVQEEEKDSEK